MITTPEHFHSSKNDSVEIEQKIDYIARLFASETNLKDEKFEFDKEFTITVEQNKILFYPKPPNFLTKDIDSAIFIVKRFEDIKHKEFSNSTDYFLELKK